MGVGKSGGTNGIITYISQTGILAGNLNDFEQAPRETRLSFAAHSIQSLFTGDIGPPPNITGGGNTVFFSGTCPANVITTTWNILITRLSPNSSTARILIEASYNGGITYSIMYASPQNIPTVFDSYGTVSGSFLHPLNQFPTNWRISGQAAPFGFGFQLSMNGSTLFNIQPTISSNLGFPNLGLGSPGAIPLNNNTSIASVTGPARGFGPWSTSPDYQVSAGSLFGSAITQNDIWTVSYRPFGQTTTQFTQFHIRVGAQGFPTLNEDTPFGATPGQITQPIIDNFYMTRFANGTTRIAYNNLVSTNFWKALITSISGSSFSAPVQPLNHVTNHQWMMMIQNKQPGDSVDPASNRGWIAGIINEVDTSNQPPKNSGALSTTINTRVLNASTTINLVSTFINSFGTPTPTFARINISDDPLGSEGQQATFAWHQDSSTGIISSGTIGTLSRGQLSQSTIALDPLATSITVTVTPTGGLQPFAVVGVAGEIEIFSGVSLSFPPPNIDPNNVFIGRFNPTWLYTESPSGASQVQQLGWALDTTYVCGATTVTLPNQTDQSLSSAIAILHSAIQSPSITYNNVNFSQVTKLSIVSGNNVVASQSFPVGSSLGFGYMGVVGSQDGSGILWVFAATATKPITQTEAPLVWASNQTDDFVWHGGNPQTLNITNWKISLKNQPSSIFFTGGGPVTYNIFQIDSTGAVIRTDSVSQGISQSTSQVIPNLPNTVSLIIRMAVGTAPEGEVVLRKIEAFTGNQQPDGNLITAQPVTITGTPGAYSIKLGQSIIANEGTLGANTFASIRRIHARHLPSINGYALFYVTAFAGNSVTPIYSYQFDYLFPVAIFDTASLGLAQVIS